MVVVGKNGVNREMRKRILYTVGQHFVSDLCKRRGVPKRTHKTSGLPAHPERADCLGEDQVPRDARHQHQGDQKRFTDTVGLAPDDRPDGFVHVHHLIFV